MMNAQEIIAYIGSAEKSKITTTLTFLSIC